MKILSIIVFPFILSTNSSLDCKKRSLLSENVKDSVFAEYRYVTPAKDGVESIILKTNKTYEYSLANHIQSFCSTGKWEIVNDTLILNSFIQKNDLPITIKVDSINNNSEYIQVDLVKYINGDIAHGAQILVNGDTSKNCMPSFENDCKIKGSELKSVQLRLGDGIASKWQNINVNNNSNHLAITINLDFFIECYCYIFFNKEKFIIIGKKLYPTEKKIINNKDKIARSKEYFLTKGVYPKMEPLRRNGCP